MVVGRGYTDRNLSAEEVREICAEGIESWQLEGRRVLAIIPDHTRTAPMDLIFRTLYDLLAPRVSLLDFLIALGTHPPETQEQIYRRLKMTPQEHRQRYPKARFFNHNWKGPRQLQRIGVLTEDEVEEISEGRMRQSAEVKINRMVFDYDALILIGPVFPHEVVGFSGGNKYLFPGIAGQEIIDLFHWLGALITSPVIIGTRHTPVRAIIDRAASFLPMPRWNISPVVKGKTLSGIFLGLPEEAWSAAADLSDKLHIIYVERPFRRVLSQAPPMYDDLWTGGKCMYKLEPVVEEGGELIIYAPHIREVSYVHGALIEKIGYHVRDYFVKQWDRFKHYPGGVLAHSTHVKGVGTFENGVERPRIQVTLATGIPEEVCRKINLGYRDPRSIRVEEWQSREGEGILYVPKAGEILYRLKDRPYHTKSAASVSEELRGSVKKSLAPRFSAGDK